MEKIQSFILPSKKPHSVNFPDTSDLLETCNVSPYLHLLWMVETLVYEAVFQEEMTDICEILVFLALPLSFNGSFQSVALSMVVLTGAPVTSDLLPSC